MVKLKATVVISTLLAASVSYQALAGCCSTPRDYEHRPPDGNCSLSRVKTNWIPAKGSTCGGSLNPYAGCTDGRVTLKKRVTQWTDPGCGGPCVGDTGWVTVGTSGQATAYVC